MTANLSPTRSAFVRSIVLTTTALTALALPSVAGADDWPQWRGPDRTGLSDEVGLLDEWPEGGPSINWQIETLGEGYSAPAVEGNRLYIQGTRDELSMVFAVSTIDGSEIWAIDLGPRLVQDKGNGPRSTPTIVGEHLYVQNGMGEVAKLQKSSGDVVWRINMLERFGSPNIRWGISESPLVDGERIYVMPGGEKGAIAALSTQNGETVWTSKELTDKASYSSLILREIDGTDVLIGFTGDAGVGVRASDGALLWRYTAPSSHGINVATPILIDDVVFYTSSYGIGGGALRVNGANENVETAEVFFNPRLQNHHGGVVELDGNLYGFFGPALGSIDAKTGEAHWRARSVGKGSLVIADGKLFMLSERHKVGLAVATPDGYEERGRFEIERRGDYSWTHPVVANGALYIRDQEALTSYDVAE